LRAGAALTVLLLAGLIYLLMRKDKTQRVREHWKEAEHVG
jgi:hypothetical protein